METMTRALRGNRCCLGGRVDIERLAAPGAFNPGARFAGQDFGSRHHGFRRDTKTAGELLLGEDASH